ncbi:MAG TPA: FtsX-like permease family protein [Jatrophihabitantaceae bacterium]|nr:FtsX-like permease family protein [Jatrophihabitantaceae bacterium]
MIRFGLRLTLRGGRDAATRLVLIATAVAIGVGLLLATLAGLNAVNTQNARFAWLETGRDATATRPSSNTDVAWWQLSADMFQGKLIGRVDVAATGPHSPVPPGIPALPGPGQFYASPAMSKLLAATPRGELGARYPGRQIGTIGDAALPAPNSLIMIIGHTPAQLAHAPDARQITSISTTSPSSCNGPDCAIGAGVNARGIDLVLSVVTVALLFPVLIFIATATRLSAARREQRFAAMRLVGATPRQVAVISTVESSLAAAVGTALGFGVFFVLRPALAPIPFTGEPFFISDLSLNLLDVVLVAVGVPLGAAVAARLALRRVTTSPLGVTRSVTPAPPRAWRLIPLLLGLGQLAYFVAAGRPASTGGQILAFLPGFLLTVVGLVIAGPWVTMQSSRFLARRAHRPGALIAARRLSDNPQAGFRAISGLVLALFVTTVAIGVITTITANDGGARSTSADRATLVDDLVQIDKAGQRLPSVPSVSSSLLAGLRSTPGVIAVLLVHEQPSTGQEFPPGLISCADLARAPALGHCAPGAQTAAIDPDAAGSRFQPRNWIAAHIPPTDLARLPVRSVVVVTNGSRAAVERARTLLELAYPQTDSPSTVAEWQADNGKRTAAYQQLANVVIIASLPIAGCTLAVSVVAGLNERKRPFSLLRLTGAPLRVLRRVVLFESAVPLLAAAAVSIATGFLAAHLFLRSQMHETLQPPGAAFWGFVAAGLIASLAIIASTLPVLQRISGPENARND